MQRPDHREYLADAPATDRWAQSLGGAHPQADHDDLLTLKIRPPQPPRNAIARRRLAKRLDALLEHRLGIVAAPAGYGKTTALAAWSQRAHARGVAVAWLALDAQDDSPPRFFRAVSAALTRAIASPDAAVPTPLLYDAADVRPHLTALVHSLAERANDVVLVLDDYHVIETPAIHEALRFLLEVAGSRLHVVLLSRGEPGVAFGTLRARGDVVEFGMQELRLSPGETASLLREATGLDLPAPALNELVARTEGWAAGVQLAGIALRARAASTAPADVMEAVGGSHRYVSAYLGEQVLRSLPPEVHEFLLLTCLPGRLCAALCNALTGKTSGQAMLEQLEREHLFLIALDEERRWYRYHHLFADLLRHFVQRDRPSHVALLHRRAAEWYEGAGLPAEAIDHWLAAHEFADASRLIGTTIGPTLLMRGEGARIQQWIDLLPPDRRRADARVGVVQAWIFLLAGRFAPAASHLDAVEEACQSASPDTQASLLGGAAVARAYAAYAQVDVESLDGQVHRALRLLPAESADPVVANDRHTAIWLRAHAHRLRGNALAAEQDFDAVLRTTGDETLALAIAVDRANQQVERGLLVRSAAGYRTVQRQAIARGAVHSFALGASYIGLGQVLREWNDLTAAGDTLTRALEHARLFMRWENLARAAIALAQVRQAEGTLEAAAALLDEAEEAARALGVAAIGDAVGAVRAGLALAQGHVAVAEAWAADAGLTSEVVSVPYQREAEYLMLAQLLLMRRQAHVALNLLRTIEMAAERGGRLKRVLEVLVLRARAHAQGGERTQALAVLARAIHLGEPEGFVRVFADAGHEMVGLLRHLRATDAAAASVAYCARLLAACTTSPQPASVGRAPTPTSQAILREIGWIGLHTDHSPTASLTARERDVLQLVAEGASNREIADRLVITVATVKKHLTAVFHKVGVSSRAQLIVRARTLGITS